MGAPKPELWSSFITTPLRVRSLKSPPPRATEKASLSSGVVSALTTTVSIASATPAAKVTTPSSGVWISPALTPPITGRVMW